MEQAPKPKHITPPEIEELRKKGVTFVVNSQGQAIETDSDPNPKIREKKRDDRSHRLFMESWKREEMEKKKHSKNSEKS